ncbi:hypothetical protein L0M90_13295, partial [[Ruminococcus] torques]
GQRLADGDLSAALPLNPEWDKDLLQRFKNADFDYLANMSNEEIRHDGGRGGQEIRAWIAAFAALAASGEYDSEVHYYE